MQHEVSTIFYLYYLRQGWGTCAIAAPITTKRATSPYIVDSVQLTYCWNLGRADPPKDSIKDEITKLFNFVSQNRSVVMKTWLGREQYICSIHWGQHIVKFKHALLILSFIYSVKQKPFPNQSIKHKNSNYEDLFVICCCFLY